MFDGLEDGDSVSVAMIDLHEIEKLPPGEGLARLHEQFESALETEVPEGRTLEIKAGLNSDGVMSMHLALTFPTKRETELLDALTGERLLITLLRYAQMRSEMSSCLEAVAKVSEVVYQSLITVIKELGPGTPL